MIRSITHIRKARLFQPSFQPCSESHFVAGLFVLVHHADDRGLRDVADEGGDHSHDQDEEQERDADPDECGDVLVGVVEQGLTFWLNQSVSARRYGPGWKLGL